MIVRDKAASLAKANEVTGKILAIITNESKDFITEDDPSENIYLAIHILGNLFAKVCISLEGFGKIYNIPNLTSESIKEWIDVVVLEYLKINETIKDAK